MSSVVLSGDSSGTVTLTVPSAAGTNTVTLPAATGTVMVSGNQPAFGTYQASVQSITTATFTKVTLDTEEFDTNNNFASNRFTPTVAGYYQINGSVTMSGTYTRTFCSIFKNGSEWKRGNDLLTAGYQTGVTSVVYLNGSTDYVELYCWASGTSLQTGGGQQGTYFSGAMVRSA